MKIYYPPQKTLHCYNLVISHTSDQSQPSTFSKSIHKDKKLDILEKNLNLSFVNKYIHLVILYKNPFLLLLGMKLNKLKIYKLLVTRVNDSANCIMSSLQQKLISTKQLL